MLAEEFVVIEARGRKRMVLAMSKAQYLQLQIRFTLRK